MAASHTDAAGAHPLEVAAVVCAPYAAQAALLGWQQRGESPTALAACVVLPTCAACVCQDARQLAALYAALLLPVAARLAAGGGRGGGAGNHGHP